MGRPEGHVVVREAIDSNAHSSGRTGVVIGQVATLVGLGLQVVLFEMSGVEVLASEPGRHELLDTVRRYTPAIVWTSAPNGPFAPAEHPPQAWCLRPLPLLGIDATTPPSGRKRP